LFIFNKITHLCDFEIGGHSQQTTINYKVRIFRWTAPSNTAISMAEVPPIPIEGEAPAAWSISLAPIAGATILAADHRPMSRDKAVPAELFGTTFVSLAVLTADIKILDTHWGTKDTIMSRNPCALDSNTKPPRSTQRLQYRVLLSPRSLIVGATKLAWVKMEVMPMQDMAHPTSEGPIPWALRITVNMDWKREDAKSACRQQERDVGLWKAGDPELLLVLEQRMLQACKKCNP
jgi:hypothetical protein